MVCFLQLQNGDHLNLNAQSGSLLLNVCNDNVNVLGGDPYSYERTKRAFDRQRQERERLEREKQNSERLAREKQLEIERIESKRLSDLSDQFLQAQLIKLLKENEAIKNAILLIEQRLRFMAMDEEDVMIILMSSWNPV